MRPEEKRRTKKKKKSRKRHHSSTDSSPVSSSCSDSGSSVDHHRRRDKRKHRQEATDLSSSSDTEHERRKHRRRRHHETKSPGKNRRKEDKEESEKGKHKRVHGGGHSDEVADKGQGVASPEEVASIMLQKFPELANDLEKLLKMLDDGQAVDISGLTNKQIAGYLKELFRALQLHKTSEGLFLLPDNALNKTLDILAPMFYSPSDQLDRSKKGDKGLEEACNKARQPAPIEQKRRVLGPVMPSAEMLEAAARLTEAGPSIPEADDDLHLDPFVGPPPPAAVKEAESANEAERLEEVERILAPDVGNAYELLGLRVDATAESLKKRYWKLSLLVHPDKCTHPRAHEAFTALNQAFKDLQDPSKRSIIDKKIEEKETREEFEAELKAKKEAAQWRKIRGEALPGDDALLDTPKAPTRDEWMTQLPPERKVGAPPQQSTFFRKSGKSGRGDTSIWTDTPLEKAQKTRMGYLEAQKYATLEADANAYFDRKERDSQAADILDQFNSSQRATSLMEKHQIERSKKVKKSSKKDAAQPAEWAASHPWKPWEREKDLASGRKSVNLDKLNMGEGLSLRFSSSHKERSFL